MIVIFFINNYEMNNNCLELAKLFDYFVKGIF